MGYLDESAIAYRNKMNTYLSIDLDYWNGLRKRSIDTFFAHVFQLQLPIWIAPFHDQLLPHINQHDCDTLINVDYHSDIADFPALGRRRLPCNEGTWANFVKWKKKGTFIWRYSHPICPTDWEGYCHNIRNPFEDARVARWKCILNRAGLRGIPWHTVKAVACTAALRYVPVDRIKSRC
jgi:hypothetical protein